MKKIILIFVSLILISSVNAVPNPASVFCSELGYGYNLETAPDGAQSGYCVFPDGSKCTEWDYYCKCKPEDCPRGNRSYDCDFPCGESICKKSGESSYVFGCCEGLQELKPIHKYDEACDEKLMAGWTYVCSDCGNNNCEEWESKCNCPEDCEETKVEPESQEEVIHPEDEITNDPCPSHPLCEKGWGPTNTGESDEHGCAIVICERMGFLDRILLWFKNLFS